MLTVHLPRSIASATICCDFLDRNDRSTPCENPSLFSSTIWSIWSDNLDNQIYLCTFFEFSPAFETDGFRQYRQEKNNKKFDSLIATIEKLNTAIENDETLGRGFRIGHSYFCTDKTIDDMWLNAVITYEIVPLLNEYWFDEPSKVRDWEYALREAIR